MKMLNVVFFTDIQIVTIYKKKTKKSKKVKK